MLRSSHSTLLFGTAVGRKGWLGGCTLSPFSHHHCLVVWEAIIPGETTCELSSPGPHLAMSGITLRTTTPKVPCVSDRSGRRAEIIFKIKPRETTILAAMRSLPLPKPSHATDGQTHTQSLIGRESKCCHARVGNNREIHHLPPSTVPVLDPFVKTGQEQLWTKWVKKPVKVAASTICSWGSSLPTLPPFQFVVSDNERGNYWEHP